MSKEEKRHLHAWLTNFKEHFLAQEIYPNRYLALYFEILRHCHFNRKTRIGLIPCELFSVEFSRLFKNSNFHFFNNRRRDVDNFSFIDDHEALASMDTIFLFTDENKEEVLKQLPPSILEKVVHLGALIESLDFQPYIRKKITNWQFLKFLTFLKEDYKTSLSLLLQKGDEVLFVRQNYYSDVQDKVCIVATTLGKRVVVEDNSVDKPIQKEFIHSRLLDIVVLFLKNRHRKKSMFFIPILRDGYGLTYVLKRKFFSTKVISNFTDYIYDLCRYDKRELIAESYQWSLPYTDAEYYFADKIVNSEVVDAIIHRHGDAPESWSNVFRSPSLFFPPYQNQYKRVEKKKPGNKLVFIGAVHSAKYDSDLFKNMFLEKCFKALIDKGFTVDLYYPRGYEIHAKAYTESIKSNRFTIRKGKPLEDLLLSIHGQYDWGLLLTDFHQIKEKINVNYRYTIPTKIYTYLGIYLPILCYIDDSSCFTELITRHGLGRVITKKDLISDNFNVSENEYQVIINNIYTYNCKYNLKKQTYKLVDFLKREVNKR